MTEDLAQGVDNILVAIRARKLEDSKGHGLRVVGCWLQVVGYWLFAVPTDPHPTTSKSAVETRAKAANIGFMKLLYAFAVWIGMGVVLGTGILLAVKGSPWLLIAAFIGFVIAVGKIGCMAH